MDFDFETNPVRIIGARASRELLNQIYIFGLTVALAAAQIFIPGTS